MLIINNHKYYIDIKYPLGIGEGYGLPAVIRGCTAISIRECQAIREFNCSGLEATITTRGTAICGCNFDIKKKVV